MKSLTKRIRKDLISRSYPPIQEEGTDPMMIIRWDHSGMARRSLMLPGSGAPLAASHTAEAARTFARLNVAYPGGAWAAFDQDLMEDILMHDNTGHIVGKRISDGKPGLSVIQYRNNKIYVRQLERLLKICPILRSFQQVAPFPLKVLPMNLNLLPVLKRDLGPSIELTHHT
eukprot:TRINITY_DN6139_c0_g1_i2.p1 TRINITY_DN6139_c0_g1~~TRINITY_DN6139_c0_g1_i2.p1  ORF type:complete len:172 (+),score=23.85 TRINITY_DN6139_c0_g1_i2:198-713(+)